MDNASVKRTFDVPRLAARPIRANISYFMQYGGRVMPAPNVPMMQRSSLAQQIVIHRTQDSTYLSNLRYYGLRPDYPAFHALTTIRRSPMRSNPKPLPKISTRFAGRPGVSQQGTMGAMQRFKKALPNPINIYHPPVYGQGS